MNILSVNVGRPRETEYRGKKVISSIWKEPVQGPVEVGEINLAGDRQATALVHGGIHKAVYAFSHDRYDWWQRILGRDDLVYGMFGENLTVAGLDEGDTRIGDKWQAGTARFVVTGPRIPCSNLAMRFADESVPRRFSESGWSGVYLRVLQTGTISADDGIALLSPGDGVNVRGLFLAYTQPREAGAQSVLSRALRCEWLDPELASGITKRLRTSQGQDQ